MNLPPTLAAFVLSVGPGLLFLFAALRGEEGRFDDRRFFFALLIGLGMGAVAGILHMYILVAGMGALLGAVLAGALETGARLMILNLRRFRGLAQACVHGLAMGVGMGSGAIFLRAFIIFSTPGMAHPGVVMALALLAGALPLAHGATGVLLGSPVWRGGVRFGTVAPAVAAQALFDVPLFLWYGLAVPGTGAHPSDWWWLAAVAFAMAAALFAYAFQRVLRPSLRGLKRMRAAA